MNPSPVTNSSRRSCRWEAPHVFPALMVGEVHVWRARLKDKGTEVFERILSDDERERAERFRSRKHTNEFIVSRGILRTILAKYLYTTPSKLEFEYSEFEKPSVRQPLGSEMKFSVSHSDGTAIYAFSRDRGLGIDLESKRPLLLDELTVSRCLTAKEVSIWKQLSVQDRIEFFFQTWTKKESYLKALGVGLTLPPNQIETSLLATAVWSFETPPPIPGFAAAIAVKGGGTKCRYWMVDESKWVLHRVETGLN